MPALGADMDEGTVLEWLVKPGDEVHKGDVIAVIDTAKSAIDVESFFTGTVERLVTGVGQTVPVGTVLATITESPAESAAPQPAGPPAERKVPERPRPAAPRKREKKIAAAEQAHPAVTISPLIRKRAHELGVDLAKLARQRSWGRGHPGRRGARRSRTAAGGGPQAAQPGCVTHPGNTAGTPCRRGVGRRPSRCHRHRTGRSGQ